MEKPDVDLIEGLSPAISIEQKATSHNPRSTVGTVTEIHDYLRLLFARVGTPLLPRPRPAAAGADGERRWSTRCWRCPEEHAPDDPRAGGARAQGRARASCSTSCGRRASCACASTAQVVRDRRRCRKLEEDREAHIDVVIDRLRGARRHASSAWPKLRDRAAPRRRPRDRGRDGHRGRARSTCSRAKFACPICNYSLPRARAAPVLVQLADGRLPELRRPGPHASSSIRSAWSPSRRCRSPAARSRAGTGATSTTSSMLREPRQALRLRRRHAVRGAARERAQQVAAVRLGRRRDRVQLR